MINWINNFLWYSKGYKADKPKHFWWLGFDPALAITAMTYFHFYRDMDFYWRVGLSFATGFGGATLIGGAKEIVDWYSGKYLRVNTEFDRMDWYATSLGGFWASFLFSALVLIITGLTHII